MFEHNSCLKIANQAAEGELPLSSAIKAARQMPPHREIKTVGLHFWGIPDDGNGTVYVIKTLSELLTKMGLRVCVLTEDEPSEQDVSISAERFVVPKIADEFSAEGRKKRMRDLAAILQAQSIDLLIDNQFYSPLVPWNGIAAKSCGCRYVVYDHGYLVSWMCKPEAVFADRLQWLRVCDAVVSLTEAGKRFYDCIGIPAIVMPNPPTCACGEKRGQQPKKRVLWLGRLDPEKKPLDALCAFAMLHDRCADAELFVAGDGDLMAQAQEYAAKERLQNVRFLGFQADKESLFAQADVLLMTSESESWSLSLHEALAHGIPAVCYDLPNLDILREDCGVMAAAQDDAQALSDALFAVLTDEALYGKLSENAIKAYKNYCSFDFSGAWKDFLQRLNEGMAFDLLLPVDDATRALVQTMARYHSVGMQAVCAENERLKPLAARGKSVAYKLGAAITWLPRKLLKRG